MKRGIDYIGVGVGAVVVNRDNKFFLALRGKQAKNERGKWEFPGGSVEFGDTIEETIVREIKEEYGFDIEIVELLGVTNHLIPDEKQHWLSPAFICKVLRGVPKILEPHKCDDIGWFSLEEISKLPVSIVTKNNLDNLYKKYPDKLPNFYN